jgi:hypothetical protein
MSFVGHRSVNKPDGSTADSWHTYTCGLCGTKVSGAVIASVNSQGRQNRWLACTSCGDGSVEVIGAIYPGVKFGPPIEGLPADVAAAYDEARGCMQVSAYTAAELLCRKILMHVAVDKQAKEGLTFAEYIDHLAAEGYVTPPMNSWVDLIRKHGNAATHKLPSSDKQRAESTVMFTAELLRLVYEMAHMASKYAPAAP